MVWVALTAAAAAATAGASPPPSAPQAAWTIDPGPALTPGAPTPHVLWFADGRWALVMGATPGGLWALDTTTGAWSLLAAEVTYAAASPDGRQVATVAAAAIQLTPLPNSAASAASTARALPWPATAPGTHRLVAWLDRHTLLRVQQHDAEPPEGASDEDEAYGVFNYRCDTLDLRTDPPTAAEVPCPEGGFSFLADLTSDGAGRLLMASAAEGCLDLSGARYAPPRAQQPMDLPSLNLYPSGDARAVFSHSGEVLLTSPCALDAAASLHEGCMPERDPAPWHLFLWSASFARPKRLYQDLPPQSLPDASARRVVWPVEGGVCGAALDPPSQRRCWPLPSPPP